MDRRILPIILTLIGLPVCAPARVKSVPGGYYAAECFNDKLTVFPTGKGPITIPLPSGLTCGGFRADGKALYASGPFEGLESKPPVPRQRHFEIQFNTTRVSDSPGFKHPPGFRRIYDHVESQNENRSVFAGQPQGSPPGACGIYDFDAIGGNIRHVIEISGCNQWRPGGEFRLSPDGEQLLINHNRALELIDLLHGTSRSLGELGSAAWSPDGKWIAAVTYRGKLVILDAHNFSQRRLGAHCPLTPQWSPDSRYLLLSKYHLFRCGFSLDVDGPATLVTVEIATGKKSIIGTSQCRIQGATGWVSGEIITQ